MRDNGVLFYGAGAVSQSLMAFCDGQMRPVTVLARSGTASAIGAGGVLVECQGKKWTGHPNVSGSLTGLPTPDFVVIGVKATALDDTVADIISHLGNEVPVVSVLNGIRHVGVLESTFPNAIFATIGYNAYRTAPNATVAMANGPIALSKSATCENSVFDEVLSWLKAGTDVSVSPDPIATAYCKLVINLGNAPLTMTAFHLHRERQLHDLQHIMARVMYEGMQTVKASGMREARMKGMPTWALIGLNRWLPQLLTVPIFKAKMQASAINSMAQDASTGAPTEIEEINGEFLRLADRMGMEVPYNRAIYRLFKQWYAGDRAPIPPSGLRGMIKAGA